MDLNILLFISIVCLALISRKENFHSFESDFIPNTGRMRSDQPVINAMAKRLKSQVDQVAQTGQSIPRHDSFARVLGLQPNFMVSDEEVQTIQTYIMDVFPNVAPYSDATTILHELEKHEENFYSFVFYLQDSQIPLYYGRVKATIQIQNNAYFIHQLTFQGLVTPLSVHQIASIEDLPQKHYHERERVEPKFLNKEQVKAKVQAFEDRKDELILLRNIQARHSNEALNEI